MEIQSKNSKKSLSLPNRLIEVKAGPRQDIEDGQQQQWLHLPLDWNHEGKIEVTDSLPNNLQPLFKWQSPLQDNPKFNTEMPKEELSDLY